MTSCRLAIAMTVQLFLTQAVAEPIRIDGTGIVSCGTWTQQRAPGTAIANIHANWIIGFVNGVRWAEERNWGPGIDAVGLVAWVDTYCQSNPLDSVAKAAGALIDELKKRSSAQ